jgi:hypothetical protein
VVHNAKVNMFQNAYMRLVVDRWGRIEEAPPAPFDVAAHNLSAIQYEEIVA